MSGGAYTTALHWDELKGISTKADYDPETNELLSQIKNEVISFTNNQEAQDKIDKTENMKGKPVFISGCE